MEVSALLASVRRSPAAQHEDLLSLLTLFPLLEKKDEYADNLLTFTFRSLLPLVE